MYEEYWSFKEKPFQNTPDPRYLYLSSQHEEALMKLTYAIAQGLGCGLLTGVFGCGKTLLARVILNDLGPERFSWAYVSNPLVSEPAELLRAILRELNPQKLPEKRTELLVDSLLEKIQETLLDNIRDGKQNVIVIDEAHTIEDKRIFEQLRMLLNLQTEQQFLLTLLMLGQPELKAKVEALKPLSQRIPIRCHLDAMKEEEVQGYINHRLKVASAGETPAQQSLFSQEIMHTVFTHTQGVPRKINTLCDLMLLSGFAKKVKDLTPDFVESVVKEFNVS